MIALGHQVNVHVMTSTTGVTDGEHAQMQVSVSLQSLMYQGQLYEAKPDMSVDFIWNNDPNQTLHITYDDFKDSDGNVDWNQFHTFQMEVLGNVGSADQLDIVAHNQENAFVGFAIDHVSLQNCTDDDVVVVPDAPARSHGYWANHDLSNSENLPANLAKLPTDAGYLSFDDFFNLDDVPTP